MPGSPAAPDDENRRRPARKEEPMKKFMAVYTGSIEARRNSGWDALDESTRKEREASGLQAWMDWGAKHAAAIVDQGGPLGKTKRASRAGIADTRNSITGYVIVQAESHDAAVRMFENHPHFTTFPGDSVEVMDMIPIPGT
jgi:transcription antitermination factor NusG